VLREEFCLKCSKIENYQNVFLTEYKIKKIRNEKIKNKDIRYFLMDKILFRLKKHFWRN